MDTVSRNKWQVRGVAILIFVLGFAAGMLALGSYRAWARRTAAPGDRFNQMATRLQLNDDQKTKVQQIFGDTRQQLQSLRKESEPRVNEIRQATDQKLQQVLTPVQWNQFQQLRSETRSRRGPGSQNR
ncbi:MAG TPA: periplasmic heavy metal sensor [Pyrinomonadaceae bacterium]|jgi:Spy/CpxP family protein refolding chaperone|nr:periplasmic heavy metal sensor [Pyrinomonadaceae bacterium]